ncbi:relaxase/mobilization nuclease domain-containing protein [Bacteroides fragilis]|uniref:relaxase/mobilization nuclease domain-containing protein n=1 Tax=Bacteroides fragilis TaxID=817 RepID=UPI001CE08430|nr:relaxase/mobilization nuclease domain-containing protein [Bacteroides fragilis]MCA5604155.1 relaxase/mobilization nuclease domain-containing protein [Bacteroides fragilis]
MLTDIELQNIAREYLENSVSETSLICIQHEDIDRHHLHIVTVNVDENGKKGSTGIFSTAAATVSAGELEQKYGLHPAERKKSEIG